MPVPEARLEKVTAACCPVCYGKEHCARPKEWFVVVIKTVWDVWKQRRK